MKHSLTGLAAVIVALLIITTTASPALATVTGLAITSVEISPSAVTLDSDHVDITIAYAGAAGTGDVYFVADTVKWDTSVCYNEGQYGHFCSWNVTGKGCDGHNCKKLTCGFKSSFMNIPADSDCLPTGCQQEARQLAHIASPSGSFTFTIPIAGIELGTYSITVGAWSETSSGTLKKISGPDGYCRSTLTVMPKITGLAITSVEVSPSTVTLDSEQADLTVHYDGANGVGDVYFVADTVKWDTSVCVDEGQYGYFCSWDTTGLGCDGHNCKKLTCGFKNPFMNIPADSDCLPTGCQQEARQLAHIASPSGSFTFSLPIAGMEPGDYSITVGAWSETSPGILNKLSGPEGYCRSALTVLRKMEVDVNYPGEAEASNFMLNSLDNYLLNRPFPGTDGLQSLLNSYKDPGAARITVTDSQTGEQLKDITVTASGQYEYPERPEGPSISAASSLSAMSSGFRQYYDYYPIDLNLPFPFLGLAYPDSPLKNAEYYYYPQQFENVVVSSSPFDFPIYYDDHNYGNFDFYLDLYKEGYASVSSSYPFEVVQNKLEIQLHPTGFPDQEAAFAPENIRLTISPQSEVSGTTSCNVVIYYSDRGYYGDWAPWDFGIWPPEHWAFFQVTNVQNNVENDLTFDLAGESTYWYSTLFPRETYGYYESDGQGLFFARAFCQNLEGTDVATTSFFIPKLRVDFEGSPSTFAGTYFPLKYRAAHLAGKDTNCRISFDGSQYKELPEVPSGVQQTELIPVEPGHHYVNMWCSDDLIEGWGYFEFDVTEPPSSVCGNNACEPGETESSCPQDCLATQLDKLDTSPTMCWNETCNFDSHPAGFKIDNRYITQDGNIVTVEYNNWQEGIPFMTSSLASSWTNKQWLGLQKRINATGLGKRQVYARINAPNTNWWLMLKNSNGDAVYTSKFTPKPEWSDWKRLDLSPDANNTLRLTLSGLDGVSGQKGIKVQYLAIDPDKDFPIFAVPVNYHLTDPHAISDSRFESRVNSNITDLFVTKVWRKLPDLRDTPPSRVKIIPLSRDCPINVRTSEKVDAADLKALETCLGKTEFKLRNAPNLPIKGRIVGLESQDNWETSTRDAAGFTFQNDYRVFVDNDGGPISSNSVSNQIDFPAGTVVMHEFGHTWGLYDEYNKKLCKLPNNCTSICLIGTSPNCAGNPITFADVNSDRFPNDLVSYLGTAIDIIRLKPYSSQNQGSKYNATDIMGIDRIESPSENVSRIDYETSQKEFNEANLRRINSTFWNELSANRSHSIMMLLAFRIFENGTVSLLSSGMKDGYFASPIDAEPSNQTYLLRVYSANGTLLYNQTFKPEFLAFGFEVQPTEIIDSLAIPYLEDAATFRIEKLDSTPVFAINVPEIFCNKNGICDASENYLSCPSDCLSGSKDGYCDGLKDGIADPDCSVWQDPDYSCNNNNVCEPDKDENAFTCQSDCQLWAQDGVCPAFTDLKDGHCDPDCGSKDPDCAGQTGWSVFTAKTTFSLNLGETEVVPIHLTNLNQQENRTVELSIAGLDSSLYNLSFNTVIIPAGEIRGIALTLAPSSCLLTPTTYNFSIFVTSEGETRQLNASLEIKPTRKVFLSAQPDSQELGFAENTSYLLKVSNLGNIDDSYSFSAFIHPDGSRLDYPQSVEVSACSNKAVNLTVLPTGCSVKPGNYTISASLISQSDQQTYAPRVTVLGTVTEVNDVYASLIPAGQQANPGQTVGYTLSLKNDGNMYQNLTTTIATPDLPTSVFWTWTRNMTSWISPVQHSNSLEACGQASLTLNATVPKDWPGFNETAYQFAANITFSEQNVIATASLQVNATFNSSMFYKIETADYLLGKLEQLRQQDKISKQDYNLLRKQYARLKELGETALYGKIASKTVRDKDDEKEREAEKGLGLNKDEMEELQNLEKEYSDGFQNPALLKNLKRDVLLTYLIDKQLLLKQNLVEKARCRLPRQKYCDTSWTSEFLLYNKYIRGSDFRAIKELLERQKLEVMQELADSTCKEKQKQAASKMINKGNVMLSSLNISIDMGLKEFLKENKKTGQILESYMAAHNILDNCKRVGQNER